MDPTFGQFVTGETPQAPPADVSQESSSLRELAAARARMEAQDQTIRDLARRPVQQAQAPVQSVLPPLGPMPDPTTHPSEFAQWTASKDQRNAMDIQRQIRETRDEAYQAVRARDITNGFIAAHPEYRGVLPEVQNELGNVVTKMGLRELPDDPTEIHKQAAVAMREREQRWKDAEKAREGSPHAQRADANRVEGTAGGTTAPAPGKKAAAEPKPISMIDAIKKQQMESGFF